MVHDPASHLYVGNVPAALQTAFRTIYADWTGTETTITTPGYGLIIPALEEVNNPAWAKGAWGALAYDPLDSRSLNAFFSGSAANQVWTGTITLPRRGAYDNVCALLQPGHSLEGSSVLRL